MSRRYVGQWQFESGKPPVCPRGDSELAEVTADSAYETVQRDCWSASRHSYIQSIGGTSLDASVLAMPLVKFAGPNDPRFLSTLEQIGAELVTDSLVRRYQPEGADGLDSDEGTFNLCSFWYVEALTRAGRLSDAQYIFEKMLTHANHVGLFSPRKSGPLVRP